MTYTTFFEIGGHVIESYVDTETHGPRPAADPLLEIAKKHGVPKSLARAAMKESSEVLGGYDVARASRGVGRIRRARRAVTIAAALAAVDGPLPIGDTIAIGFLGTYAAYEMAVGVTDLVQK